MRELKEKGVYRVSDGILARLKEEFACGCCDDGQTVETIGRVWREHHYLMDPHTAVAWHVADGYAAGGSEAPLVVLSTASPYKFPSAVLRAVGGDASGEEFAVMQRLRELTGVPVPAALAQLSGKAVRHRDCIDRDAMRAYVDGKLREASWKK